MRRHEVQRGQEEYVDVQSAAIVRLARRVIKDRTHLPYKLYRLASVRVSVLIFEQRTKIYVLQVCCLCVFPNSFGFEPQ
jgi:hypothetical protein